MKDPASIRIWCFYPDKQEIDQPTAANLDAKLTDVCPGLQEVMHRKTWIAVIGPQAVFKYLGPIDPHAYTVRDAYHLSKRVSRELRRPSESGIQCLFEKKDLDPLLVLVHQRNELAPFWEVQEPAITTKGDY